MNCGKNIKAEIEKDQLYITIDLSQSLNYSSLREATTIASTLRDFEVLPDTYLHVHLYKVKKGR